MFTRYTRYAARFRPLTVILSALFAASTAGVLPPLFAQVAEVKEAKDPRDPKKKPDEIIVIGNPLGTTDARDVVSPVSSLSGEELLMRRGNTLGETLNGLPGVSASWFGPNSGRPVIRGLDGDRVRVLTNLGSSLDASSLSFDHNPSIDPLIIERVEVLRGPAALLYGGTAIGGVVNVIDNRIPGAPVEGAKGAFETRGGGADGERSVAALVEAGNGMFAIHADAFKRSTDDYRVPASTGVHSPVVNSSADASGGALGASLQFANGKGSAGISHSTYTSNYGTVAEATVRIDMKQTRTAAEFNLRDLGGAFVDGAFLKASQSEYNHVELDGAVAGTTFKNKGTDVRGEIKHARVGSMQGVVGFQQEQFDFSALGAEAFVPETKTTNRGIFIYEEISSGAMKYALGARAERSEVDSRGAGSAGTTRFGRADQKRFSLASASAGLSYRATGETSFTANFAANERAPTYYELFADGPHVATAAYEVGDRQLSAERATSLDIGFAWKGAGADAGNTLSVGLFAQSFSRFLALRRTGAVRDAEGNSAVTDCGDGTSQQSACTATILPEYRYQSVSARLTGAEVQGTLRVWSEAGSSLSLRGKFDYVKAEDRTHNEPLPRIAPLRFGAGATYVRGKLTLTADVDRAAKQTRVAPGEIRGAVDGHTLVGASALYGMPIGSGQYLTFFLRGTNLGNRSAFNAASIDTIRYLSPLPGRSIKAGVRLDF